MKQGHLHPNRHVRLAESRSFAVVAVGRHFRTFLHLTEREERARESERERGERQRVGGTERETQGNEGQLVREREGREGKKKTGRKYCNRTPQTHLARTTTYKPQLRPPPRRDKHNQSSDKKRGQQPDATHTHTHLAGRVDDVHHAVKLVLLAVHRLFPRVGVTARPVARLGLARGERHHRVVRDADPRDASVLAPKGTSLVCGVIHREGRAVEQALAGGGGVLSCFACLSG